MNNFKTYLFSIFLGAVSVFTFAPFFLSFLWLITIPLFKLALERSSRPLLTGWAFGFGLFSAYIYWFSYALMVDPDKFAWLIPFAVFGIGAFLGLYFAAFGFIYKRLQTNIFLDIFSFASIWIILEIVRNYLLTGFPWNLIGYSLNNYISQIQIGSIIGVYGLGFLIVLISASFSLLKTNYRALPVGILILLLSINYLYGNERLKSNPTTYLEKRVRLVQPNISQHEKWHPDLAEQNLNRLLDLTLSDDAPSIIIWPEAAFNYTIYENSKILNFLGNILPEGSILITGSNRYNSSEQDPKFWNSLHVINDKGKVLEFYDKSHLVPFGEYMPFSNYLPFEKIVPGFGAFTEGLGLENIDLPNYLPKFSPLICYEVIFPQKVALDDTELMINVTNDAWYLDSSGPYQHYEMARFRSIEEGLPLIRVANTGITAIIDPMAREIARTNLLEARVIDGNIPKALDGRTFYSKYGNIILYIIFAINAVSWIRYRRLK